MIKSDKKKAADYFICSRCKTNSLNEKWCPCPRGGCEARIAGTVITQTIITLDKNLNSHQKQWNKKNHR